MLQDRAPIGIPTQSMGTISGLITGLIAGLITGLRQYSRSLTPSHRRKMHRSPALRAANRARGVRRALINRGLSSQFTKINGDRLGCPETERRIDHIALGS